MRLQIDRIEATLCKTDALQCQWLCSECHFEVRIEIGFYETLTRFSTSKEKNMGRQFKASYLDEPQLNRV
jgi:hypothetical protein